MSSRYYRSKGYRNTIYVVSWALAVFYLLASGRGLVPGLCATQNAMDAQVAARVSDTMLTRGMGMCCVLACAPSRDGDSDQAPRPISPREAGCAFCTLVTSVAPAVATVELPAPQLPAHTPPKTLLSQRPKPVALGVADNRAPPV